MSRNDRDIRALRTCFGQFATGVAIVTTGADKQAAGVTINSFSSVSLDPPLVLWSIGRKSRSFETFKAARKFCVNILSSEQIFLAQRFASSSDEKFNGIEWFSGRTGVPVLSGTIGTLECEVTQMHEGGDHLVIIGEVAHFDTFPGEALLFAQSRYCIAVEHPEFGMETGSSAEAVTPPSQDEKLFTSIFMAYHSMSAGFDSYRHKMGLTLPQTRALNRLYEGSLDRETLFRKMFLPYETANDAVLELIERGDVYEDKEGRLSLTEAGIARREALARYERDFERRQTRGLEDKDVAQATRVLAQIARNCDSA